MEKGRYREISESVLCKTFEILKLYNLKKIFHIIKEIQVVKLEHT